MQWIILFVLIAVSGEFWYVSVPLIAVLIVTSALVNSSKKKKLLQERAGSARMALETDCIASPDNSPGGLPDREVIRVNQDRGRYRDQIVDISRLGSGERDAVRAARSAVAAVLGSPEYKAGTFSAIREEDLRRHLWAAAVTLREISELRAGLPPETSSGPAAASVIAGQKHALGIASTSVRNRVIVLQDLAAAVRKADAARKDWETAQKLSRDNDKYRDLLARTAGNDSLTAGLSRDVAAAQDASQALQEALASVAIAAGAL